jgi:hypothetical protein
VNRIFLHDVILELSTDGKTITVKREGTPDGPMRVEVRAEPWKATFLDRDGNTLAEQRIAPAQERAWAPLTWKAGETLRLERP